MTLPYPFILSHQERYHPLLQKLRDKDLDVVSGGDGTTCGTSIITPDCDGSDTSGDSDD